MFKNWMAVALGGGLGAVGREALMMLVIGPFSGDGFNVLPIFVANITAAFLIGLVAGLAMKEGFLSTQGKLLISTGIMGGLSTFSSFIWAADNLIAVPADRALGLFYIFATMIVGFLFVQLGLWLGERRLHSL